MFQSFQEVLRYGDPQEDHVLTTKDFISNFEKETKKDMDVNLDVYIEGMKIFENAFVNLEQ